jgi:hypothetical protein
MEKISKYFVEPSQATEARRQRNFRHGHARFMDEVFSEQDPPRLGHGNGRSSEVLEKQSSQLAFANAKAFCERIHAFTFAIEGTFSDKRQRAGNSVGGSTP